MVIGGFYANIVVREAYQTELRYRKSGAIAEQALGSIKVVKAFGQEDRETKNYNRHLYSREASGRNQAILRGLSMGLLDILQYLWTFVNMLIGAIFVREAVYNDNVDRDYRMGDTYGCFYSVYLGLFATGIAASNVALMIAGLKS